MEEYRSAPGDIDRDRRHRNPKKVKGVRTRLRTLLRVSGITIKFRTDISRNNEIWVRSEEPMILPVSEFEGFKVINKC